jgi:hypothetical protein
MKITRQLGPVGASSLVCRRWARGISSSTISLHLLVGLALLSAFGALVDGQQPGASPAATPGSVKHVLGFENIKPNAKGDLTVQGDTLQFKAGKAKAEVNIASVQDVFTEQDFKQSIGGTAGTLAKMAVPYGGGRVLSLFQEKIDVLTVEYRDANGGLHGAIFTLPQGQAQPLKRQLVALGAHASIPPEEPAKPEEKKQ